MGMEIPRLIDQVVVEDTVILVIIVVSWNFFNVIKLKQGT